VDQQRRLRADPRISESLELLIQRVAHGHNNAGEWTEAEESEDTSSESDQQQRPQAATRVRLATIRSKRRVKQFLAKIEANSQSLLRTPLEDAPLTTLSQARYRKSWNKFLSYLKKRDVVPEGAAAVDAALVAYFNVSFLSGEQAWQGEVCMAALCHFYPQYGKYGDLKVPRAWRALRGWRRLTPQQSRRPHPLLLWQGMCVDLIARGHLQMAVYVMVSLSGYLRPSEAYRLRRCDLIPPCRGVSETWSLLVNPAETGITSKTGTVDDSISLDSEYMTAWCEAIFMALRRDGSTEPLWSFDWPSFLVEFRACRRRFGVPELVPYQLRHSGASIDRSKRWRSLAEVKKRGNWKQDRSVARYEKAARLNATMMTYSPVLQSYLHRCASRAEAAFRGSVRDFPHPPHP